MTPRTAEAATARSLAACPPSLLEPLRGARLLMTGATGFLGRWMLQALAHLNTLGWAMQVQCVSRDPQGFLQTQPWVADAGFDWLAADARDFAAMPLLRPPSHIVHLAAVTDARRTRADPSGTWRLIVDGTHGCVEQARRSGARLLFASSGAVYGTRRASAGAARENQIAQGAPDPLDTSQAYGNAKRMAEAIVACDAVNWCITRPFAFLGPGLPLDQHFAAAQFVCDAVAHRPIRITGDGLALRSYMHPADHAAWTLALLGGAPNGQVCNIGSDEALSIAQLAHAVAARAGSPLPLPPEQAPAAADPPAYWPDVETANGLGLRRVHTLADCIDDTLAWASTSTRRDA